ncbi:MAG: hypothetical protein QXR45_08445 [Candidatus Bathyarchaeia archaeon]
MSRKKPKFLGEGYDIKLVQTPPPGPPEYELLNAWPRAPRSTRHNRESRTSIIISLLALIIAIFAMSPHLISPLISTTSTTTVWLALMPSATTTTVTYAATVTKMSTITTVTTTTEKIHTGNLSLSILPMSSLGQLPSECDQFRQNVRLVALQLKNHNMTHRLLSLIINISSSRVDESNFSVKVTKYNSNMELHRFDEQAYNVSIYYRYEEPSIQVDFKIRENQECQIINLVYQE